MPMAFAKAFSKDLFAALIASALIFGGGATVAAAPQIEETREEDGTAVVTVKDGSCLLRVSYVTHGASLRQKCDAGYARSMAQLKTGLSYVLKKPEVGSNFKDFFLPDLSQGLHEEVTYHATRLFPKNMGTAIADPEHYAYVIETSKFYTELDRFLRRFGYALDGVKEMEHFHNAPISYLAEEWGYFKEDPDFVREFGDRKFPISPTLWINLKRIE